MSNPVVTQSDDQPPVDRRSPATWTRYPASFLGSGSLVRCSRALAGARPSRIPRVAMALGAVAVATSSVFIELSGASPGTSTFYRCLLSIPLLAVPAWVERRSQAPLSRRGVLVALAAGVLFAGDAMLWTAAIHELGAGMATVVVNAQVLIVPLLALVLERERLGLQYLAALPLMVGGICLTAGVVDHGSSSTDPFLGVMHGVAAALCYSGFLYLLRRGGSGGLVVQPYVWVIGAAGFVGLLVGMKWRGVDLPPGSGALGWLVLTAIVGQSVGWLLVAIASPRLPSSVGAALLLLTRSGPCCCRQC